MNRNLTRPKLVRITTVPLSLNILLKGQLAFMNKHFEVIGVSSGPLEELEAVGEREGIRTELVAMTRSITPFKDLLALGRLYRLLRKEKPLIVHTHTPKAGTLGMIAAKFAGVPYRLHTVAGLPLEVTTGAKRKLLDMVEKVTYSCAHRVYPNSPGLLEVILENEYCEPSKLKVIGVGSSNGIDTTQFDPAKIPFDLQIKIKEDLGIQKGDFVFIFIGRIVKDKGINELIEAFTRLQEEAVEVSDNITKPAAEPLIINNLKLILVGPYEQELDPLDPGTLKQIEENPFILSVGFQEDVRPFLAISHVLTFPSYREGFPNVVLQAGAMGLPCIVTDINGCNEIIQKDVNGEIVRVKQIEELYQSMHRIITDPGYYQNLKKNAREMITRRFKQQVIWEAILDEYKKTIS